MIEGGRKKTDQSQEDNPGYIYIQENCDVGVVFDLQANKYLGGNDDFNGLNFPKENERLDTIKIFETIEDIKHPSLNLSKRGNSSFYRKKFKKGKESDFFKQVKTGVNQLRLGKSNILHLKEVQTTSMNSNILTGSFLTENHFSKKNKKISSISKKIGKGVFFEWRQETVLAESKVNLKYYDGSFQFFGDLFQRKVKEQVNFEIFPEVVFEKLKLKNKEKVDFLSENKEIYFSSTYCIPCFTAAVIALRNYDKHHSTSLIRSILMPHEKNSKFFNVKIFKNGCFRRVKIDPVLPQVVNIPALTYTKLKRKKNIKKNFFMRKPNTKNPESVQYQKYYVWASFLEKALMKLYGFQNKVILNSSPCIEVYHLSGWLPEIIPLASIQNFKHLWSKIFLNFYEGNAIFFFERTLNKLTKKKEFFVLKNLEHDPTGRNFGYLVGSDIKNSESKIPVEIEEKKIDFEEYIIHEQFTSIHLCWSPFVFPKRKYFSGVWYEGNDKSLFWNEIFCLYHNPQFLIKIESCKREIEVRILIERHVKDLNYRGKKEHEEEEGGRTGRLSKLWDMEEAKGEPSYAPKAPNKVSDRVGYKLFQSEGDRVFYSHDFVKGVQKSDREVFSDAFVFEKSSESRLYSLSILKANKRKNYEVDGQEIFFTLGVS